MSRVISIVPARGGSKGLKNKNILPLNGKPLIEWSIMFSRYCGLVNECIVSTDSNHIAQIAKRSGATVPFLRKSSLAEDDSKTSDVIIDVIERCGLNKNDIIILLEPTSPYREVNVLDKIITLMKKYSFKKVVSISEAVSTSYHFQFKRSDSEYGLLIPLEGKNLPKSLRRQDIDISYFIDGSFYSSYVSDFLENPDFIEEKTGSVISSLFSSFEIDNEDDLKLMEAIFKQIGVPFTIK